MLALQIRKLRPVGLPIALLLLALPSQTSDSTAQCVLACMLASVCIVCMCLRVHVPACCSGYHTCVDHRVDTRVCLNVYHAHVCAREVAHVDMEVFEQSLIRFSLLVTSHHKEKRI